MTKNTDDIKDIADIEDIADSVGELSPTTEADLAAFKVGHPLDNDTERLAYHPKHGIVIEHRHTFEIYRFHAPEIGTVIFDVGGIKAAMVAGKLPFKMFDTPLAKGWVEHMRKDGGVEVERMKQLTAADLARPIIGAYWPHNGCITVIDGNNRAVRRWDDGLRTIRLAVLHMTWDMIPYLCSPGEEHQFMDRDAPPESEVLERSGTLLKGLEDDK